MAGFFSCWLGGVQVMDKLVTPLDDVQEKAASVPALPSNLPPLHSLVKVGVYYIPPSFSPSPAGFCCGYGSFGHCY